MFNQKEMDKIVQDLIPEIKESIKREVLKHIDYEEVKQVIADEVRILIRSWLSEEVLP